MNEEALNTKYLVYAIVPTSGTQRPKGIAGVNGQAVFLVSYNGLTAVASRVNPEYATPRLSRLLAFKEVIEVFHRGNMGRGIIPIRYGCMVDDKKKVRVLLDEHHTHYASLLKDLAGCVEMGIRILISEFGVRNADCGPPNADSVKVSKQIENRKSKIEDPGKAYLTARKSHYAQEEKLNKELEHIIERFRALFSGLFVKCKTEVPSIGSFPSAIGNHQVLSMYFLVPRVSLDRFREVFRQADTRKTVKLLLSGPWPPYNFVEIERI